jgi:hypothetical protein
MTFTLSGHVSAACQFAGETKESVQASLLDQFQTKQGRFFRPVGRALFAGNEMIRQANISQPPERELSNNTP